jgi:peptidoglycan-associated lipoprotein
MRSARTCCALLVTAAAVSACHPRSPATAPSRSLATTSAVPARPPSPPPPPVAAPRPAAPLSEAELFRRKSLAELNAEHPLADAFFDYNQNILREDARQALQHDAQWLAKWPQTVIRIDGHCDERGTAEYNLALGERRAQVVRDYLTGLGVRADRIQTRSMGREAPFCRDSGETCWSQNRRGHFEITDK